MSHSEITGTRLLQDCRTGLVAACLLGLAAAAPASGAEPVEFNRDVRPILSRHCFACHGPDEEAREANLRLDTARDATGDLGGYRAVEPGAPEKSELIARIQSQDSSLRMPPSDSGPGLTQQEQQILHDWIASGADYDVHWAFVPPVKRDPPKVDRADWPRHPIDSFVLARLEEAQLEPAAEADRYRLIRRVSLDLTGLPPTPEAADAFADDTSDDAFEKVVNRLLNSDAYGERWARVWLDLARYADTKGYEKDRHRDMWPYRDWVIRALNNDLPFDQFTIEQIAGDLLPDPTPEQLVATAFHRNTMTNDEGGTDNEEFRVAAVKDRVDTTIQVWMGLTMGCAKCHSHKYDPITHDDYYAFYAFFNQTQDADRPDDAPTLALPNEKQQSQIDALQAEIQQLEQKLQEAKTADASQGSDSGDASETLSAELEQKRKELAAVRSAVPQLPVMRELDAGRLRDTRVHVRGNFLEPGERIAPDVPTIFGQLPEEWTRNRLAVARWLVQDENPLTARVMVNRVWARLFGVGIVETEEDFGVQGTPPTHPHLLDWLAVDFRENGWSLKQLMRTIVLSSTYRQSAVATPEKLERDPRNRLVSRGPRFRLSAEMVRDQALAVSSLLVRRVGGPSVMPPQPPGIWKSTYNAMTWQNATGADRYRRAIYTYWKRTSPYPAMTTFDAGSGEVCQIRRVRTNTPLQALVTLNDVAFIEAAGGLARRMAKVDGPLLQQLERGFRLTLIRPPCEAEVERLQSFYESMQREFAADEAAAAALLEEAHWPEGNAALVAVANVLLNLDETMVKP